MYTCRSSTTDVPAALPKCYLETYAEQRGMDSFSVNMPAALPKCHWKSYAKERGMHSLSVNMLRPSAKICSIRSSKRFNPSLKPSTPYSSLWSSLSSIGPSRLIYSNERKHSSLHYKAVFCVRASQSDASDAQEPNNPDAQKPNNPASENFPVEERKIISDSESENDQLPLFAPTNAGNQLNQDQLQEVLKSLSHSLAVLSSALSEVSSVVRVLSASLSIEQQQPNTFVPHVSVGIEIQNEPAGGEEDPFANPPEPWDTSTMPSIPSRNVDETIEGDTNRDSSIPQHLVEQNRLAHRLAYRLQQSFIQARIDGLGKPFEVAVEEFTDTCMEAHQKGIGLKELQLQLILQDGSLAGAFALRNQRFSNDPLFDETSRIRSLWVRLVYSTIAQMEEMKKLAQNEESSDEKKDADVDGTETFVNQVIKKCLEQGYDLGRIKLEQNFAGETTSPSIKAMRQNHYLVLLVVDKVMKSNKDENSTDEKQSGNSVDEAS